MNIHSCCTAFMPMSYEKAKQKAQEAANLTGLAYIVTIFNTVIQGDERDEYTTEIVLPDAQTKPVC